MRENPVSHFVYEGHQVQGLVCGLKTGTCGTPWYIFKAVVLGGHVHLMSPRF